MLANFPSLWQCCQQLFTTKTSVITKETHLSNHHVTKQIDDKSMRHPFSVLKDLLQFID